GYGLVDSDKTASEPGKIVNITAKPAPSASAAAEYYPAIYWYSMLHIPSDAELKNPDLYRPNLTQRQWLGSRQNLGCIGCHQLGQLATRPVPASLGTFPSGSEAWHRRVQSGQAGALMFGQLNNLGPGSFTLYGDWTDRIAKGELPKIKPQRPQ